jgi:diguanylate cyclase (GGDEF)-like protein
MVLAGFMIWIVVRYRTRHLEVERKRLEEAVAARSAELVIANRELAAANAELKQASLTDPLTHLPNRRFFHYINGADISKSLRRYAEIPASELIDAEKRRKFPNRDLVFYLVDIDHFKNVNDLYGHAVGDALLVKAAQRINAAMRKSDTLIRWGGEEFLVVSYPTERCEAETLARRIISNFCEEPFDLGGTIQIRKTCSVGWAPFPWFVAAPHALNYEEVLQLADRALYMAKESGRNRAVGLFPTSADAAYVRAAEKAAADSPPSESDHVSFRMISTAGPPFSE